MPKKAKVEQQAVTFYLPEVMHEKLLFLSKKLARSKSEIIRTALREYLPTLEKEVKGVGELAVV